MPNVSCLLSAVIQVTEDTTGNVVMNRGTGNPSNDYNVASMVEYRNIGSSGLDVSIPIPMTTAFAFYIRNLHASAQMTVKWAANGIGGLQSVLILDPGAQVIIWNPPSPGGGGIQQLTVNTNTGNTPFEYFFAGT